MIKLFLALTFRPFQGSFWRAQLAVLLQGSVGLVALACFAGGSSAVCCWLLSWMGARYPFWYQGAWMGVKSWSIVSGYQYRWRWLWHPAFWTVASGILSTLWLANGYIFHTFTCSSDLLDWRIENQFHFVWVTRAAARYQKTVQARKSYWKKGVGKLQS